MTRAARIEELHDSAVTEAVAERTLRQRYRWAGGLGWMRYDGGRWDQTPQQAVLDEVRRDLRQRLVEEAQAGATADRLRKLAGLLMVPRCRAVVTFAEGILLVNPDRFDAHPDLLNVGIGVVDLATGQLRPHDPTLYLTRQTPIRYIPAATHPDWTAALQAVPDDVRPWLHVRLGQATTGHMTSDDRLPVLHGSGANGKTTVMTAVTRALGTHAAVVSERVLLANPTDHPVELMPLRGARLALIEELPEGGHLSVKRLKDTLGSPTMTARMIRGNPVTWDASHSLVVTSNYKPKINETDHGTWRRLSLVRFPYTYRAGQEMPSGDGLVLPADRQLRDRVRNGWEGQHEAVLAWLVAGAVSWYRDGRVLPEPPGRVAADTVAWRSETDLVCGYIMDRLVFDPDCHIAVTDLHTDFNMWAVGRGHRAWALETLTQRFETHSMVEAHRVERQRRRSTAGLSRTSLFPALTTRYTAWDGLRFRTESDLNSAEEGASGQGGQGYLGSLA